MHARPWAYVSSRNPRRHRRLRTLVLVIGPKALASDYVVSEKQHAVSCGKAINPILRLGDFPLVPDELKLLHVEDFRENARYDFHFENLVRQISDPVAPMGKLVGVPSLPHHFLTRSDCLQPLKAALLADLQLPVVVTSTTACIGIHGMAGIGKSVLANLLARDIEVRRAFPDGVLWLLIGIEPDVVELQSHVAKVFGDPGYFKNSAQGRTRLEELLASKAVLIVLDDLWERTHAESFNVLGPRCRAVITTRDAGLVSSLGVTQHQAQLFTETESLYLLVSAAGLNTSESPPEAKEIVSECGRLPLAVALCAGMFKRGFSWTSILQRLKQAALEGIADRNVGHAQHANLWKAMKGSLDTLMRSEQRRFIELSVFPKDSVLPEAAVRTLWSHTGGLDNLACEDLLISLSERSLIHLDTEAPQPGQAPRRHVSLHNLLADFAVRLAGDLVPLNNELLGAYQKLCPSGWSSGPNDGYLFQGLSHHLLQSGRMEELIGLLQDLSWAEAKVAYGMVFDLVKDFGKALMMLPRDDPRHRILGLLEEALVRDVDFIARHARDYPQGLFQCLWNSCWWFDSEGSSRHYEHPRDGWKGPSRWNRAPKVSELVEKWRSEKEAGLPFRWLRAHRPPEFHLGQAMRRIWRGQTGVATCVAASADGRFIATGSDDHTVCLWDTSAGHHQILRGHTGTIVSVSFSSNGLRVASLAEDRSLRIWDVTTDALHAVANGEHSPRGGLFWIDEEQIATLSTEFDLQSCHADTGAVRVLQRLGQTIGPSAYPVELLLAELQETGIPFGNQHLIPSEASLAVSGRGQLLAVIHPGAYHSCDVIVRDLPTQRTLHTFRCEGARHLAFSVDGQLLAVSIAATTVVVPPGYGGVNIESNGSIKVFDLNTGLSGPELYGHEGSVLCAAFLPDDAWIVSCGDDNTVRLWRRLGSEEETPLRYVRSALDIGRGQFCDVAISEDGRMAKTLERALVQGHNQDGSFGGQTDARFWDVASGEEKTRRNVFAMSAQERGFREEKAGSDLPLVLCIGPTETSVIDSQTGRNLAWFPGPFIRAAACAEQAIFAGIRANHLDILSLEGPRRATNENRGL